MFVIVFTKKESNRSSTSDVFSHDKIIAIVQHKNAVAAKLNQCLDKQRELLKDEYRWIYDEEAQGKTVLPVTVISENEIKLEIIFSHCNDSNWFKFSVRELENDDLYNFDTDEDNFYQELAEYFRVAGYAAEFNALDSLSVPSKKLTPLLFLNDKEEIKKEFIKLSQRTVIWVSSLSTYNKYDPDNDKNDRFVGLSPTIAMSNQKVIKATKQYRGDCMDEISEGNDNKPCNLTLFPNGGEYILYANTEKLEDDGNFLHMKKMLLKCPVSEFVSILTHYGFAAELAIVPATDKTAANFTQVIIKLVKNDLEGARTFLQDLVSKKRKTEEVIDETGINPKLITAVMKKVKNGCTRAHAVDALRKNELDKDQASFMLFMRLSTEGSFD